MTGYTHFGGLHPETASLANILRAQGIHYSEAMLLGLSGGLGAGYILYEFYEHNIKVLVLGFHNRWQYPVQFYETLCNRLGLKFTIHETGSKKSASSTLNNTLASGKAALVWVDRATMPYFQLPPSMQGHTWHVVSICGMEDTCYLIDDLAGQPFRVPFPVIEDARSRIGSLKNRLLLVDGLAQEIDLKSAVLESILQFIDHLSSDSESFSLPALRKWAKMMTDTKNKKGWPNVFQDRRGLYSTLRSLFEAIEIQGAPGGLRGMYADFLTEAAAITGNGKLAGVAERYRALADEWHKLAEIALPDGHFARTKTLLRERQAKLMAGSDETQPLTDELKALSTQNNLNFPFEDREVIALFGDLQSQLQRLYEGEIHALTQLKSVM